MAPNPEDVVQSSIAKRKALPSLYAGIMDRITATQGRPDGSALAEINRMVDRFFSISTGMLGSEGLTVRELERLERFHIDIESELKKRGVGGSRVERISRSKRRIQAMHAEMKSRSHGSRQKPEGSEGKPGDKGMEDQRASKPAYRDLPEYARIKEALDKGHEFRETFSRIWHGQKPRREVHEALGCIYAYCMKRFEDPDKRIEKAREIAGFESYLGMNAIYHMRAIAETGNAEPLVSKDVMDFARKIGKDAAGGYFYVIWKGGSAERLTNERITKSKDVAGFARTLTMREAIVYFREASKADGTGRQQ